MARILLDIPKHMRLLQAANLVSRPLRAINRQWQPQIFLLSYTFACPSHNIKDRLTAFLNIAAGFEFWPITGMEEAYEFTYFALFVMPAYTLGVEHDGVHHICGEGAGLDG